jgi:hypothetical protein
VRPVIPSLGPGFAEFRESGLGKAPAESEDRGPECCRWFRASVPVLLESESQV